ncbi:GAF domain-containing SpoIIE family protein phosphatase [Bacillus sp. JCM 19034]|uniref:GAF domain-containing SpoIIE family protein phosphatase n=1 Tax=Bacillus sp. JCM 19034 TaxID=1481928 RepID=UPI000785B067|nr:GAF domain-containing protein [Bacillus sp. JCM 19034]
MIQHSDEKQIVIYSEEDERQRLHELYTLHILDSEPEEAFDRITRFVARLFHVPISFVSLITEDRQWFKSCVGIDLRQTERELSLCQYVIATKKTLVVPDTKKDERFKNNPLLDEMGIRFYAGAQLRTKRGHIVGTLCIGDPKPREFTSEDQLTLEELANWVVSEMELRATIDQQQMEKEALQKEIKWAGSLQRQLLPSDLNDPKIQMKSLYLPSNLVSGDFYNYHWITNDRLFGYIVDVMGHGVPTALQTSAIRVLFSQAIELQLSLKETVEWINRSSIPFMPENYYFTAFLF